MPTTMPNLYYKMLMLSPEPASVPLQLNDKDYRKMLKDIVDPDIPLAVCDTAGGTDTDSSAESDEGHHAIAAIQDCPRPVRNIDSARHGPHGATIAGDVDTPSVQQPDTAPEVVPPEAGEPALTLQQGFSGPSGVRIGAKQVTVEKHLEPGAPGSYVRLIVQCSTHIQGHHSRPARLRNVMQRAFGDHA